MFKIAAFLIAAFLAAAPAFADDAGRIFIANKAATGSAAWATKQTLKVVYAYSGQGLTGTVSSLEDLRYSRFVDSVNTPPEIYSGGFDGTKPWLKDTSGGVSYQEGGGQIPLSTNEAYRNRNLWWQPDFGAANVVLQKTKQDDGVDFDVLTVTPKGGSPFDAWFDAKTHLLARTDELQGPQTIITRYSDYSTVDGVQIAGKKIVDDGSGAKYVQTLILQNAQFLPALPPKAYAKPAQAIHDYFIAGGASATTIPFQLKNNHIYAGVKVNGKGPFKFIFDTGGHNILTPETAKALTAKVVGEEESGGAGEATVDEGDTHVDSIQIGKATLTNQLVSVLDFQNPGVTGYVTQGIIGAQTYRRFVTRFDYGAHTITLIDPKHFDPHGAGTPIHFVFDQHVPVVKGSFEGISGNFDIDTGARTELTLTRPFAESENLRATHPKGVEIVDGWGVGGPARSFVTMGKTLTIGPIVLNNIVTSFSVDKKGAFADATYQGNIGAGVLKRFVVTFDYPHQIMYLTPLKGPIEDVGTFDRAGMWINEGDGGFKIVSVGANTPAADAGLKEGDVIAAVNGKPATGIPVYEMRQRLRDDASGTMVALTVKRGGEMKNMAITLRDLI